MFTGSPKDIPSVSTLLGLQVSSNAPRFLSPKGMNSRKIAAAERRIELIRQDAIMR